MLEMVTIFSRCRMSTWASVPSVRHFHYHVGFQIPHLHIGWGRSTSRVSTANHNIAAVVGLVSDDGASSNIDFCCETEKKQVIKIWYAKRFDLLWSQNRIVDNYLGPVLHVLVL